MDGFTPIQSQRLYQEIAERILEMIRTGRLKPGDLLPSERELAQRMNVSRVSVRDAIRVLEARGILEVRQGEGTRVRTPDAATLVAPLGTLLEVRRELVRHLFDLRRMIEPQFAAEAARRITPAHLERLQEVVARQAARTARGEFPIEEDEAFHRGIVEATGNPVALEVHAILAEYLRGGRDLTLQTPERAARSLEGHRAILKALAARDPAAAREGMWRHIHEVEALLFGSGQTPTERGDAE